MARYNNEDQLNLEELLEEGFLDRFKARGAQALGAVKGAGQQLKGGAQQMAGNVVQKAGNLAAKGVQAIGGQIDPSQNKLTQAGQGMQQAGQQKVQVGGNMGNNAKIDYMKKNITKRINNFVANLNNDVQKLGLNTGEIKFISDVQDTLEGLKQNLQTNQATPPPLPQQSQATPPPLPQQSQATPPPLPQDNTVEDQVEPEDDGVSSYAAQRQQRSDRSKRSAAKRKQQQSKLTPNPKKSKSRNIQKTYDKNFVRENYDKLFWGE
jgi:hypothetical protein